VIPVELWETVGEIRELIALGPSPDAYHLTRADTQKFQLPAPDQDGLVPFAGVGLAFTLLTGLSG
jgi:hypothetical protein